MECTTAKFTTGGKRSCTSPLRIIPLAQKPGKMPPSQPVLEGQGHGTASFFLSTRLMRSRVALRHVARHVVQAKPAHPTRASEAQAQPLHRAQSVCGPDAKASLCAV